MDWRYQQARLLRSPLGGYQHRKPTSNVGFNRLVNVDGGHRGGRDLTEFISQEPCVTKELTDVIAGVERLIVVAPLVIFGLVLLARGRGTTSRRFEFTKRLFESSRSGETSRNFSGAQPWSGMADSSGISTVGYFFGVLSLFTFALFLQEAVLEPYGGAVFGMDVCASTRLNATWGIGTLAGIASTGFLLVPRLGPQRTALVGGLLSAVFVMGMVIAGATSSEPLFKASLLLFGYSAGVSTNASLTLMLGLTSPLMAGTFIGVWGLAQAYAEASPQLVVEGC